MEVVIGAICMKEMPGCPFGIAGLVGPANTPFAFWKELDMEELTAIKSADPLRQREMLWEFWNREEE